MSKPQDKFPLIEMRRLIRELYFKFDELSDEEFDALVDDLNGSVVSMRSVALERRKGRVTPPIPANAQAHNAPQG